MPQDRYVRTSTVPPAPPTPTAASTLPAPTIADREPNADAEYPECPQAYRPGLEGRLGNRVVVYPECFYLGVDLDELWQLAISQALAGGEGLLAGPTYEENSWRERLLRICMHFDDAAWFAESEERLAQSLDAYSDLMPGQRATSALDDIRVQRDALAPFAYWQHPSYHKDPDVPLDMELTLAAAALRSGAARGWVYAALTATDRYCPEYRQHLRQHRSEILILQETLRRCLQAETRGHNCLRPGDLAGRPIG